MIFQLLSGVNYIFNVTAAGPDSGEVTEKTFNIDNIQGNQELLIEGRSNMFSVVLVGGQMTYADLDYILEAQIITCFKTQDYYVSLQMFSLFFYSCPCDTILYRLRIWT